MELKFSFELGDLPPEFTFGISLLIVVMFLYAMLVALLARSALQDIREAERRKSERRQKVRDSAMEWARLQLKSIAGHYYGYVGKPLYHGHLSFCVVATTFLWVQEFAISTLMLTGVIVVIVLITRVQIWRAPRRKAEYLQGCHQRVGACLGIATISFVRAPLSYLIVGSEDQFFSSSELWGALFLLAIFGYRAHQVWREQPTWLKDLRYGQKWEKP